MFSLLRSLQNHFYTRSQSRILNTKLRHSTFHTSIYFQRARNSTSYPLKSHAMSSIYDQSIPVMIKYLTNASKLLDRAVAYADEKGIPHEDILTFRLRDDMRPYTSFQFPLQYTKLTTPESHTKSNPSPTPQNGILCAYSNNPTPPSKITKPPSPSSKPASQQPSLSCNRSRPLPSTS